MKLYSFSFPGILLEHPGRSSSRPLAATGGQNHPVQQGERLTGSVAGKDRHHVELGNHEDELPEGAARRLDQQLPAADGVVLAPPEVAILGATVVDVDRRRFIDPFLVDDLLSLPLPTRLDHEADLQEITRAKTHAGGGPGLAGRIGIEIGILDAQRGEELLPEKDLQLLTGLQADEMAEQVRVGTLVFVLLASCLLYTSPSPRDRG